MGLLHHEGGDIPGVQRFQPERSRAKPIAEKTPYRAEGGSHSGWCQATLVKQVVLKVVRKTIVWLRVGRDSLGGNRTLLSQVRK